MTVAEILKYIDTLAPFESAENFDNCGLLVGDSGDKVKAIGLALDITDKIIITAEQNGINLIITHHPVIFNPIKSVCADSVVYRLIKSGISVISAHTNLDKSPFGTNAVLENIFDLKDILSPEGFEGMGRIGTLKDSLSVHDYALKIKKNLSASGVRYYDSGKAVSRVAYMAGSGGGFLACAKALGADTFITGDIKHDVFVSAQNLSINVIEAGHFDAENPVMYSLHKLLSEQFKAIPISVLSTENEIKTI